jgi:hypothetical protein
MRPRQPPEDGDEPWHSTRRLPARHRSIDRRLAAPLHREHPVGEIVVSDHLVATLHRRIAVVDGVADESIHQPRVAVEDVACGRSRGKYARHRMQPIDGVDTNRDEVQEAAR